MAKKSAVQKNEHRRRLVNRDARKRAALKAKIYDKDLDPGERFETVLKLDGMPRNGAKIRLRNRCEISGRPRAFYHKFKISRIALREMASRGLIPGVVKSSW